MGEYDFLSVAEAPDEETLATLVLRVGAAGNVRSKTMRAFDAAQDERDHRSKRLRRRFVPRWGRSALAGVLGGRGTDPKFRIFFIGRRIFVCAAVVVNATRLARRRGLAGYSTSES